MINTPFLFTLHNWRKFDQVKVTIPQLPLCIVDQNGSGKTSIIAAFYSLCTSKPWPGLSYRELMKSGTQYFGVSGADDWFLNGSVSQSGRVISKFVNETEQTISVMTYLPTDNQWFFLTRTQKLFILDTLLSQAQGREYLSPIKQLQVALKQKNALLKRYIETGLDDVLLATEYTRQIDTASQQLWVLRDRFFQQVLGNLSDYFSWIESDMTFELKIQRSVGASRQFISVAEPIPTPEYNYIWQQEKSRQRILFGAQRDDFDFYTGFNTISALLSRGEMRLFVLFLKYTAMKLHPKASEIIWLLDDIFNEFDQKRELILFESVLSQSSSFIATSTKVPTPEVMSVSVDQICQAIKA